MKNTITAHVYGGNKQGTLKKFEIMDELPKAGNLVDMWDPEYIWGEPEAVRLDPEQRTGHDDEIDKYEFYKVEEISVETPEDGGEIKYIAINKED